MEVIVAAVLIVGILHVFVTLRDSHAEKERQKREDQQK